MHALTNIYKQPKYITNFHLSIYLRIFFIHWGNECILIWISYLWPNLLSITLHMEIGQIQQFYSILMDHVRPFFSNTEDFLLNLLFITIFFTKIIFILKVSKQYFKETLLYHFNISRLFLLCNLNVKTYACKKSQIW